MSIAIADWQRFGRRRARRANAVAAKLSTLESSDTRVLSGLRIGATEREIDHLVISPAGVFTVTVHEVDGRDVQLDHYAMTVDGEPVPYARQAKFDAEQVARTLGDRVDFDVPVRGCVVLLTGSHTPNVDYATRPVGVSVLTKSDVPRWFRNQPAALTATEIAALAEATSG